jgi:hypothetical protein
MGLGRALGLAEAHEEAAGLALVLGPLPAVLVVGQPPAGQVGIERLDGLDGRLEATPDLPDAAHVRCGGE